MSQHHQQLLSWQGQILSRPDASSTDILHRYCRFMTAGGCPLFRVTLALNTLHPQMQALRYVWYDDERDPGPVPSPALFRRTIHHIDGCTVDEAMMSHGARNTVQYQKSPFYRLQMGATKLSFRLACGASHEFSVLDDLAGLGATHYVAYPLAVHEGQISLVTRAPGGFSDEALGFIEDSLPCLSALLGGAIKDLILNTVLDCYVGSSPAKEIKQGNIRPGSMLDLHGAIWFSDIRNYSVHAQNNQPADFIGKLNAYYETVVSEIYAQQGDVLKFIGDAVLAIFVDSAGLAGTCQRALAAAQATNLALATSAIEFDHGIGLHLGRFQFGNIGSLRRMDFTAIGSDVNLASRIESQCALQQTQLLMSAAFAEQCGQPVQPALRTALKGFAGEHLLYTTARSPASIA